MSKTTTATVKVMLSYNYCHFEVSKQIEGNEITNADIDAARKECQRLADKAVGQYQKAKAFESKRANQKFEKQQLETEVQQIKAKHQSEWTVTDKAKVKALEDHNWELQFDYEDDEYDYRF